MGDRGVALVTGAGSGIGHAAAARLLEAGFDVAMADLAFDPHGVSTEPPARGSPLSRCYRFDLADVASHESLLTAVADELGEITCLVNNAGVSSLARGDLLDVSLASFDRSVAVNLRGTFFLSQAVARLWLTQDARRRCPGRSMIIVSSANAEIVGENRGDYCITKAGLTMMTKLFASRLAGAGVAVFEVRPGIIATKMTAPAADHYTRFIREGGVPWERWGTPEDVARTIATLAQGDIPFATGIHIDVSGGLQMHRV